MIAKALHWLYRSEVFKSFVRNFSAAVFNRKCLLRRGEFGQKLYYRPAEYPVLLLGPRHFEPETLRQCSALLTPGENILDVGANIGLTVQRFDGILKGHCRVWAFEPSPHNLELLRRNVQYMGSRVTICDSALGGDEGQVRFLEELRRGGRSRLANLEGDEQPAEPAPENQQIILVTLTSIDRVVRSDALLKPTLIKIDVEGAAAGVLRGARETLEQYKPVVFCSFHSGAEKQGVLDVLRPAGYRGLLIHPDRSREVVDLMRATDVFVHPSDPRTCACPPAIRTQLVPLAGTED